MIPEKVNTFLNILVFLCVVAMVVVVLTGEYCLTPYHATGINLSTGENYIEYDDTVCIKGLIPFIKYKNNWKRNKRFLISEPSDFLNGDIEQVRKRLVYFKDALKEYEKKVKLVEELID